MKISKSLLTNITSISFIGVSYFVSTSLHEQFLYIGLFALSGALTNEIAIHMLFEKVPFFYGSGVIELKFEQFKKAIKKMLMEQFFTMEQINSFIANEEKNIDLEPLVKNANFSPAFDALSKTVMESPFGNMINMIGGVEALEKLREPFMIKLKSSIEKIVSSDTFKRQLKEQVKNSSLGEDFVLSIEKIVESRLNQLTPIMVKEMMQDLMREHLGWLVVWGGVFGGLIGLVSSFML